MLIPLKKLKLVKINKEEISTVQKLAREIWDEHYIKILSQEQIDYMLGKFYSTEKIQSEIEDGVLWEMLMDDDLPAGSHGKPIGFLSCKIESDKVYISKIYLKAETRGNGLGKFLLNRAIDLAEQNGKKSIYLNVNKYNTDSIAFYERNGFVKIDEGVFDIGNGYVMDDFIMELILRQTLHH